MKRMLLAAILLGQILGLASVGSASAHMSFQGNIWSQGLFGGSYSSKDPVNLIFASVNGGYGATQANVLQEFMSHTGGGWTNTSGSTMYFRDHNMYLPTDWQRATGCITCDREHARARQGWDRDTSGAYGTYTTMAAHREEFVEWCSYSDRPNHSVIDFNQERENITGAFSVDRGYSDPGLHINSRPPYFNDCTGRYVPYDNELNIIWIP